MGGGWKQSPVEVWYLAPCALAVEELELTAVPFAVQVLLVAFRLQAATLAVKVRATQVAVSCVWQSGRGRARLCAAQMGDGQRPERTHCIFLGCARQIHNKRGTETQNDFSM